MNHTLNTPSASWSVARFPKEVQNYAPTVKEPAMFSALRNGGGNVALNAYAAQAVVAWMKGEHADMALVDVGGSTYAAELPQADGTVLIATVNRPDPNGKTVRLRAAIAKPVVGTADYTFTSLPTIDRSCEVNLAPIGNDKEHIQAIYGDGFLDITDLSKFPKMLTGMVKKRILRNI